MGVIQRNSFWTTIINYSGAVLGFVCAIFLFPRFLSPDQVGLTNILKNAALLVSQFCLLGSSNVVLRYFPFFKFDGKKFNGIFTITLLITIIGIVLTTLLYFIFQPFIVEYYQTRSSLFVQYNLLVLPIALFIVFHTLLSTWLRSLMNIIISAFYFEIILRVIFIVIILLYATDIMPFNVFLFLFVCSYSVPAIGLFIYCYRCKILTFRVKFTDEMKRHIKPAITYGLFCLFAAIGSSLLVTIDSFMLGGMVGLASVAVYGIANNFINILNMPYRALSAISSPLIAEYWQTNDMEKMGVIYKKFTLNIIIITVLLFLAVWLNLDSIYQKMPEIYTTGKWAFLILFIGKFIDMATGLNSIILSTSKKYFWDFYFILFLIVIAIVSNKLLIPVWGLNGAAIATTICVIILSVLKIWIVHQFFHIQPFTKKIWVVLLIGVITYFAINFIPIHLHWIFNIAIRCALLLLLFVLPVYLLKISEEFNSLINNLFNRAYSFLVKK
jgi:O-antigen/teichoic acid export membrane protein